MLVLAARVRTAPRAWRDAGALAAQRGRWRRQQQQQQQHYLRVVMATSPTPGGKTEWKLLNGKWQHVAANELGGESQNSMASGLTAPATPQAATSSHGADRAASSGVAAPRSVSEDVGSKSLSVAQRAALFDQSSNERAASMPSPKDKISAHVPAQHVMTSSNQTTGHPLPKELNASAARARKASLGGGVPGATAATAAAAAATRESFVSQTSANSQPSSQAKERPKSGSSVSALAAAFENQPQLQASSSTLTTATTASTISSSSGASSVVDVPEGRTLNIHPLGDAAVTSAHQQAAAAPTHPDRHAHEAKSGRHGASAVGHANRYAPHQHVKARPRTLPHQRQKPERPHRPVSSSDRPPAPVKKDEVEASEERPTAPTSMASPSPIVPQRDPPGRGRAQSMQVFVAQYDFSRRHPDELSFASQDHLRQVPNRGGRKPESGWIWAENLRTREIGLTPMNYIERTRQPVDTTVPANLRASAPVAQLDYSEADAKAQHLVKVDLDTGHASGGAVGIHVGRQVSANDNLNEGGGDFDASPPQRRPPTTSTFPTSAASESALFSEQPPPPPIAPRRPVSIRAKPLEPFMGHQTATMAPPPPPPPPPPPASMQSSGQSRASSPPLPPQMSGSAWRGSMADLNRIRTTASMPANAPMHQEQRQYSSQPILRRNGYATDVVGVRSKDTGEIFTTNFNVRFTGRSGKFEARGDTVDVLLDDRVRFTMEIGDGGKAQFPSGKLAPDPEVLGNVTSLLDELGPHKLKFEHRYTANGEYRLNYVEALFWLWDSSDSIVVSDIDGTITRSDVGGMINGVLGARMGWKKGHAHPGVCFLYNHLIDETNAHIMYLTARPLNLINDTRSYIYELEQPVSSSSMTMRQLPPGPIITDTTNLTSSFRREVVDRSSHVFKTEMLSQLRDCFTNAGRDIRRYPVFLATFGNKDTDAVAYRAVGAPPVTIFIIGTDSRVQVADEFRERWTNYSDPRLVKVIMERIDLIKSGRLPDPNLPID